MIKLQERIPTDTQETPFDDLMASLFTLVTHHSLTQCQASLPSIVLHLEELCGHSEIELYPNQRRVLAKMQQLWRTRLFKSEFMETSH
jgi:hypothetical protein